MSNFAWGVIVILLLTALGTFTLLLITIKYYWGERGKPPLTGEARREQLKIELQRRAKQLENSRKKPWKTRSPSFWDNRKNSSK